MLFNICLTEIVNIFSVMNDLVNEFIGIFQVCGNLRIGFDLGEGEEERIGDVSKTLVC